jgi:transposase-like protein
MATKKLKKPEVPEKHLATDKSDFCVYEVYRKSNKTVYHLRDKIKHLSGITDKVYPLIKEWQTRPLSSVYPFIYLEGQIIPFLHDLIPFSAESF